MGWFSDLFGKPKEKKKEEIKLSDVKSGDYIFIEYYRFKHKQGQVKVLNNDPKNKVIWGEIRWGNAVGDESEIERLILPYNSIHLSNFVLLNSVNVKPIERLLKSKKKDVDEELKKLHVELDIAIKKSLFEKASRLRDDIARLMKEKNNKDENN